MHMNLTHRPRRLRKSAALRAMVQETSLHSGDLTYPLFVEQGRQRRSVIASMPGQYRLTPDLLPAEARALRDLGLNRVLLFGIPERKDATGSAGYARDGVVPQAIRAIKETVPEMVVMTDVCMCSYTEHGHCGLVDAEGEILNDATLSVLGRIAVSHARAGADVVAPSGMMDGMVQAIRGALDAEGFEDTCILSYAVKYASGFFGPFREAADGAPRFGDRRTHQMDPANRREAIREVGLDVEQGADLVMVKPALAYLDILRDVHNRWPEMPLVAYNVSGEYAMVKAAAAQGWIDETAVVREMLLSMKRAGAIQIITYHAQDIAPHL